MKRLTVDTTLTFCDIAQCSSTQGGSDCEDGYCDQRRVYERLREYERTGLEPEEVVALKEAEQKRQNGCVRCVSCNTCYRFGWHPDICQKCENESHYSAKPFCSHCGRDLRGDNHGT